MNNSETKILYEEFHSNTVFIKELPKLTDFTLINHLPIYTNYIKYGQDILDIGCGGGAFSIFAASKGANVKGIDLSDKAIAENKRSATYLKLENMVFACEDFMSYSDKETYDVIMLTEVLEHLPNDMDALKKIHKLLRKDGYLLMSVPSVNAPLHRKYLRQLGKDPFDERVGHLRRYDAVTIFNLLCNTGFSLKEFRLCEGYLRNWLFNDSVGQRLMRLNKYFIKKIVTFIDDKFCTPLWGESDIIVIAKKI